MISGQTSTSGGTNTVVTYSTLQKTALVEACVRHTYERNVLLYVVYVCCILKKKNIIEEDMTSWLLQNKMLILYL